VNEVVWHITMSVDGFIAGPDHSMDWAFGHGSGSPLAEEVRDSTGAILAGRRWYDAAMSKLGGLEGIYGGKWTGPVFVLTHHPPAEGPVTFLSDGLEEAVGTAREAAGGKDLGIFGAITARQCLEAGLLDQIAIHLAPVLLGDGVRLYGAPGVARVDLERTTLSESGQITNLRFRVTKRGV
jgi:dihydrofolate reductase